MVEWVLFLNFFHYFLYKPECNKKYDLTPKYCLDDLQEDTQLAILIMTWKSFLLTMTYNQMLK